jgi:hypothetical protein
MPTANMSQVVQDGRMNAIPHSEGILQITMIPKYIVKETNMRLIKK